MRDGQDWYEWIEARRQERIARSVDALRDLADRYGSLDVRPIVGRVPVGPGYGPKEPLRLEVIDAAAKVDAFVSEYAPLVWGALRLGLYSGTDTVGGLARIAENLAGVYVEDRELGQQIARTGWRLRWQVGIVTGVEVPAARLQVACPECEAASLWWAPESGDVRCGNPECGAQWDLVDSALAWTTG